MTLWLGYGDHPDIRENRRVFRGYGYLLTNRISRNDRYGIEQQ